MTKAVFLLLATLCAVVSRAQFNDTTIVIDGVATNILGFVGAGTNNLLIITNGAVVNTSQLTTQQSRSNTVIVTGAGSVLRSGGMMSLNGTSNSVQFTDGGSLFNTLSINGSSHTVLFENTTSTNANFRFDAGTKGSQVIARNSTFFRSILDSFGGMENRFAIQNGNWAAANLSITGPGNRLEITGASSVLSATNVYLMATPAGTSPGATFRLSSGARGEILQNLNIGSSDFFIANAIRNNVVLDGPDTKLNVFGSLNFGASSNRLEVMNGARLNTAAALLGKLYQNNVVLDGPGTVWSNSAALQITGDTNLITVTNGAKFHTASLVNAGKGNDISIAADSILDITGDLALDQTLRLNGPGSAVVGRVRPFEISQSLDLQLANAVQLNVVTNLSLTSRFTNLISISDGARLTAPALTLGVNTFDTQITNYVRVTGLSSKLTLSNLTLGAHRSRVSIENGAVLTTDTNSSTARANATIDVTGPGSTWNHSGTLAMGRTGSNEVIMISAGALVTNLNTSIAEIRDVGPGRAALSKLTIEGAGTRWTAGNNFYVGINANYNSVLIRGGATASAAHAAIGVFDWTPDYNSYGYVGSFNDFNVDGAQSRFTVQNEIILGRGSRGNLLKVSNGAAVSATSLFVNQLVPGDSFTNLTNNVEIIGPASILSLSGTFSDVGRGTLFITNGGALLARDFELSPQSRIVLAPTASGPTPVIAGNAILNGNLTVALPPSLALLPTETITLLAADTITGEFINAPFGQRIFDASGRSSFVLVQDGNEVKLTGFHALAEMAFSAAISGQTLKLTFAPGVATAIQTSTNLIDWLPIDAAIHDSETEWTTAVAPDEPQRYYRLSR